MGVKTAVADGKFECDQVAVRGIVGVALDDAGLHALKIVVAAEPPKRYKNCRLVTIDDTL